MGLTYFLCVFIIKIALSFYEKKWNYILFEMLEENEL